MTFELLELLELLARGRVEARLRAGAQVAELDCGTGARTVELAGLFPASVFCGFDPSAAAIDAARRRAARAGVSDRVTFEVARSPGLPGSGYDLVWRVGQLVEPDRASVVGRARRALAPGGIWLEIPDRDPIPRLRQPSPGPTIAPAGRDGGPDGDARPEETDRPRRARQQEARPDRMGTL